MANGPAEKKFPVNGIIGKMVRRSQMPSCPAVETIAAVSADETKVETTQRERNESTAVLHAAKLVVYMQFRMRRIPASN